MSYSLYFAVGTIFGNTEFMVNCIKTELEKQNKYKINIDLLSNSENILNYKPDILFICTSTTGSGDIPENILNLYNDIQDGKLNTFLNNTKVFIITLGDSSYGDTFAGSGKKFKEALEGNNIKLVEELKIFDALEIIDCEEDAIQWVKSILNKYAK